MKTNSELEKELIEKRITFISLQDKIEKMEETNETVSDELYLLLSDASYEYDMAYDYFYYDYFYGYDDDYEDEDEN